MLFSVRAHIIVKVEADNPEQAQRITDEALNGVIEGAGYALDISASTTERAEVQAS